jgi:hypothetical protein
MKLLKRIWRFFVCGPDIYDAYNRPIKEVKK